MSGRLSRPILRRRFYDAEFTNGQAQFRLLFQEDWKIACALAVRQV